MNEFIDMEIVRVAIGKQLDFERELLAIYIKENNHFGIFGSEMVVRKLQSILETMEKFKTVIEEEQAS